MTDADLKQLLTAATNGPWGSFFEIDHYSVWSEDGRKVGTAIMGPDARLIALSPELAQEVLALRAERDRLREALIWCSGSADFSEGGQARDGWLKVCCPLICGSGQR